MKSLIVSFLVFVVYCKANRCHQGYHGHSQVGYCNSNGCALVRWEGSNQDEYMCVSQLEDKTSARFECPHVHQRSACFDKHSEHSDVARSVDQRELSEVLEAAGIDRVCCCRGHKCNVANEDISRHFGYEQIAAPHAEEQRRGHGRHRDDDFDQDEKKHSSSYSVVGSTVLLIASFVAIQ
ncbi:unnamed protein product [Bursaphelenchus okinawaensis]|uniref:Activin_recp domain-containing protein n=1 Tax=Bursaphelenchus okinawaensis TaxID=465554 RepID=A0A811KK14_9BILA|nr:unnamed protein product [Bursaphelenchus okinawaensis]CAG9104839.1 unnamed protein product [Bursaphelenchus okinawaensis]